MIKAYVYMHIGGRTFSVSFLFFLFSTYGSASTICKWTVVMKNLKWLSARVLDSRPRDSSLSRTGTTAFSALCPWAKHITLCLVLVLPRKTRSRISLKNRWMVCKVSNQSKSKHERIQEFSSGLVQVHLTYKKLWQRFLVLNLFYRRPTVTFIVNYHFPEVPEGIQHFSGVWGGGGPIAYPL